VSNLKGSSSNASPPRVSLSHSPSHNRCTRTLRLPSGSRSHAHAQCQGHGGATQSGTHRGSTNVRHDGRATSIRCGRHGPHGAFPFLVFEHLRVTACDASVTATKWPALRCLVEASPRHLLGRRRALSMGLERKPNRILDGIRKTPCLLFAAFCTFIAFFE
jgi:hypothetical protein